jgi:hypothetical protein
MRYQHPDLAQITTFLRGSFPSDFVIFWVGTDSWWGLDFGMLVVKRTEEEAWYAGYGPDQYVYYARKGPKKFLGGTFAVESYADLEK